MSNTKNSELNFNKPDKSSEEIFQQKQRIKKCVIHNKSLHKRNTAKLNDNIYTNHLSNSMTPKYFIKG